MTEELPEFPSPKELEKKPRPINVGKIEEEAVQETEDLLDERDDLVLTKPVFVPLPVFKDILDEVSLAKNLVKENEDILVRVSDFKEDEEKEFKKWESYIKDIQQKLIYVDKTLFGK